MADAKTIAGTTLEALEKRLGVRRQAQLDGAQERPASDALEPAPIEREIAQAVGAARARLDAERRAAAGGAERAARKAASAAEVDFEHELSEARLSLRLAEGRYALEMQGARSRALGAAQDLESFRRTHALRRPAVYPASVVLAGALLVLAAALEAILSAALFDAEVAGGLLAAAAVAGGLGAANVTLGFLGGFLGLRYMQHRGRVLRLGGVAAFLAAFGLAAGLSLFTADWRDRLREDAAATANAESALAARAGLEKCLADVARDARAASDDAAYSAAEARCRAKHFAPTAAPEQARLFGLASPEAVVLLMLAIGIWAFAALKGFSGVEDPYPDYGKLDRAARRAQEDLDGAREEAREALEEAIEDARGAAEDAREARRRALADAEAAFEGAAEAIEPLEAEDRRLVRTQAALVALYRSENVKRRATPAPAGFADEGAASPAADALEGAGRLLTDARARHAAADASSGRALAALADDVERALARLDGGA